MIDDASREGQIPSPQARLEVLRLRREELEAQYEADLCFTHETRRWHYIQMRDLGWLERNIGNQAQHAAAIATRNRIVKAMGSRIGCSACADFGWLHVEDGQSTPHIERCDRCMVYTDAQAADVHRNDCGCAVFQQGDSSRSTSASATTLPKQTSTTATPAEMTMTPTDKLKAEIEKFKDVGIRYDANSAQITLPQGMSLHAGAHWLAKKAEEDDKEVEVNHTFPGFYLLDGAFAFYRAIEEIYGYVSQEMTPSFWGPKPPRTVGVTVGLDKNNKPKIVQVPWGRMSFSGIEGYLNTGMAESNNMAILQIGGLVKKRCLPAVEALVLATHEMLRTGSIYRGKAIKCDFNEDPSTFDPMKAPIFMNTRNTHRDDLILPADVMEMVETNLFTPIQNLQACRDLGIAIRRTALLKGPYGTGKTLTAAVTAALCEDNGVTYIYLADLEQLKTALYFARQYAPACIFAEDIDRLVSGDRDEEMDEVLNAMDGVDRKNDEVLVVFTTNNVDAIHPAFMRPGRVDAIIPIDRPDADAISRLLQRYGKNLIAEGTDLGPVGVLLAGQTPATAREVVERAKLRSVRDKLGGKIDARGLEQAAREMLIHVKYTEDEDEEEDDSTHHQVTLGLSDDFAENISKALVGDNESVAAASGGLLPALIAAVTKNVKTTNGHIAG